MGVIRIESEGTVRESLCEGCGGTNRLLHGYVYQDELAYGVYFAEWCDGEHPRRSVFLTVGLGPFVPRDEALRMTNIDSLWHVAPHRDRRSPPGRRDRLGVGDLAGAQPLHPFGVRPLR